MSPAHHRAGAARAALRRAPALLAVLLIVTGVSGCGLVPWPHRTDGAADGPSVTVVDPPVPTTTARPLAPYPVDPDSPEATADRPTTGAGFVTFTDQLGLLSSACTLGFFARYPDGTVVAFTAGHCAEDAQAVDGNRLIVARYLDESGGSVPFGGYIKIAHRAAMFGQDIAMIEVAGTRVQPVARAVGPVTGYTTADRLVSERPGICIVGGRTGLHCGTFGGLVGTRVTWGGIPAVEGDSGGPVYARWPDGTYTAVGVVNGVETDRNGLGTGVGFATLIADDIEANNLTLLGTR
ncbi:chymotrypsin family serine protease [Tsukamurella soli]|uniref:Trypsin n=1 Tax=Tsukamurella soli TaxID=644556 RepID=A0ABP8J269_9ACTN